VGEESESSTLLKLVSVPGLVALIVLSVALTVLARLFGTENVLREVLTELVASIGSTILVLATFGLLFRTGLERLLRAAPGGEALAQSAELLKDIVQDLNGQDLQTRESGYDAKLDVIEKDLRFLADSELPALRNEVAELRKLLADPEHERDNEGGVRGP
jgi:hypothetical protein